MKPAAGELTAPPPVAPARAGKALAVAATAAAAAFAAVLAVRPIASYDIGYHLAYGEHFLDTGRIVQTNQFIYTHFRKDILADPRQLGPGCRYDPAGDTYYFVNANWLSQVILAAVHRAGGMVGLGLLQAGLVVAIFALVIWTMRRAGVPWFWVAPAIILVAVASYERFNLRPEVFGYLMLIGQWSLLMELRFTWPKACGLVALQVLAVNLHSYFLFGVVLAGAMLLDAGLRWSWARWVRQAEAGAIAGRLRRLGAATAAVAAASLCNPWFLRGASMPFQTVLFLKQHGIAGSVLGPGRFHPWALITEFGSPFAEELSGMLATEAYLLVLCLAGAGALAALLLRRWDWLTILAVMGASSLQMRRNIASSAMILVPLAAVACTCLWRGLRQGRIWGTAGARPKGAAPPPAAGKRGPAWGLVMDLAVPVRRHARAGLALVWLGAALVGIGSVVTQHWYFSQPLAGPRAPGRQPWRFGLGESEMIIAREACDWVNSHRPAGRVFTDYETSSNLLYFTTRPHRQVPLLTNTWAFPPYVMQWVVQIVAGQRDFGPAVEEYDIGTVVLHSSLATAPLIGHLAAASDWATVQVGVNHVVFLRRTGPNAALAAESALAQESFNLPAYVERVSAADPVPAYALHNAATLLRQMGWAGPAVGVWRECIARRDDYYEPRAALAVLLAERGTASLVEMQEHLQANRADLAEQARRDGLADWKQAEDLFQQALQIKPDFAPARTDLNLLRRQMADFARGVITVPKPAG